MGAGGFVFLYGTIAMALILALLHLVFDYRWPRWDTPIHLKVLVWLAPLLSIALIVWVSTWLDNEGMKRAIAVTGSVVNIFAAQAAHAWSARYKLYSIILVLSFLFGVVFVGLAMALALVML